MNDLASYVGSFFDELARGGVKDVVISPGSRSTPLSMMAYASSMDIYVDVDERGAAFFALGLAKATGRAVALVCTSGTAVANYYPAVLEAETSRAALLVLTGDRPARLQQLGAPQTCDQLKIFGSHVRKFWNMPELNGSADQIRYARQIAREALAALEPRTITSAPVHINFPFDEPLTPAIDDPAAFTCGRSLAHAELPVVFEADRAIDAHAVRRIAELLTTKRAIALCGEGTLGVFDPADPECWEKRARQARTLCAWAHRFDIPLLADPLSQLRGFSDEAIIDNYDNIFGRDTCPDFDLVIRFGRYPVSKRAYRTLETKQHLQIVVDPLETRDFDSATTTLVKTTPLGFVASFEGIDASSAPHASSGARADKPSASSEANVVAPSASNETDADGISASNGENIAAWRAANARERDLIMSVEAASYVSLCTPEGCHDEEIALEGAYVQALLESIPDGALLFSANSMAIRAIDTFYVKPSSASSGEAGIADAAESPAACAETSQRNLTVLANRGLNGIDGTLSSALGAAQSYEQTYFLTGDLTLLHDLNAFALQHEFQLRAQSGKPAPAVTVILFNNGGGGIFDMLPQKSSDPYFQRLFLTPQVVDFEKAAAAFEVPYKKVEHLDDFRSVLEGWNGERGIHLVEVRFSLDSLAQRYRQFQ